VALGRSDQATAIFVLWFFFLGSNPVRSGIEAAATFGSIPFSHLHAILPVAGFDLYVWYSATTDFSSI
jgi:hypothetical protein